jgi:hypothetical protein
LRTDEQIARDYKSVAAKVRDRRRRLGAERAMSGPVPVSVRVRTTVVSSDRFDAADYAVKSGDWSDITDFLGAWEDHRQSERLAAGFFGARLQFDGAHRGRGEFCFPDQNLSGISWLTIAAGGGAPGDQLRKAVCMAALGLHAKARRQAYCAIIGARFECVSFAPGRAEGHRFYRRYHCHNRYCLRCGPLSFRALFRKYVGLRDVAAALLSKGALRGRRCVIGKLDFTTKNLGRRPTSTEVRIFNRAIRRFFRLVEKRFHISRDGYGCIWTDEFGHRNTNLHAHTVYCGPWLPNRGTHKNALSELWRRACQGTPFAGSFIVSIKPVESFESGLAHSLKYAGKTLDRCPDRLAELELSFHKVRRVHSLAGF